MQTLFVNEIFLSIQGESTHAGLACAFVRLAGCPLRCRWCDTVYAYQEGHTRELDQIVKQVSELNVGLVEITGGEPLAQEACPALLSALCHQGHTVLLETSGAMDTSAVDPRVRVIMDIKCPSSGMADRMVWANIERLRPHDEVKFVLADRVDYDYAKQIMARHDLAARAQVLVSTVHGVLAPSQAVAWLLADRLPARFQLQLHKYIWPSETRGV